jgi:hypothetical protein
MVCHLKPLAFFELGAGGGIPDRPQTLSLRAFTLPVNLAPDASREPSRHTSASNQARIHRLGVDATIGKRYSVRILGKYLVIIANPAEHPMHAPFPASLPYLRPSSATNLTIMSVLRDLIGGHFSA